MWKEPARERVHLRVVTWFPAEDTFCAAEDFCGNCIYKGQTKLGNSRYECRGHVLDVAVAGGAAPVGMAEVSPGGQAVPATRGAASSSGDGQAAPPITGVASSSSGGGQAVPPTAGVAEGAGGSGLAVPPAPTGGGPSGSGEAVPPAAGGPPGDGGAEPWISGSANYWDPRPARGAWARVHVGARRMLFVPRGVDPDGPKPDDVSDARITQVEYREGTADAIRDNWREKGE